MYTCGPIRNCTLKRYTPRSLQLAIFLSILFSPQNGSERSSLPRLLHTAVPMFTFLVWSSTLNGFGHGQWQSKSFYSHWARMLFWAAFITVPRQGHPTSCPCSVIPPQVIGFPELQRLSLSLVTNITDTSLTAIAQNCQSLEHLTLSHCTNLTDKGFMEAAGSLHRLQHLILSGCNQLTPR